jgi:hypothetical protein
MHAPVAHDDRNDDLEEQLAERFTAAWRSSVFGIVEAGRVLREARDKLPRGRFVEWLESRLHRTRRTADMLIAIADDPRIEKHASQMPSHWATLHSLTRLSDADFHRLRRDGTIHPEMMRKDLKQALGAGDHGGDGDGDGDGDEDEDDRRLRAEQEQREQAQAARRLVAQAKLAEFIYGLMDEHQLDADDVPLMFKELLSQFQPKA